MPRPDWDQYFLGIAEAVAQRSDCERSKVGAVIVKDRRIRATGYNGAPSGLRGCDTCPRRTSQAVPGVSSYGEGETRCVAVHAEANALIYCDREDLIGATLYITREPCADCSKLVAAAGITNVVWPFKDYPRRVLLGRYDSPEYFGGKQAAYAMTDIYRWKAELEAQRWDGHYERVRRILKKNDYWLSDLLNGENPNIIRSEN